MNQSLNEIETLAKRAARGAGLSWGMAEEAARATRWLASFGLAGPALLCTLLAKNEQKPHEQVAPVSLEGEWHAYAGDMCPIAAGAALNDCADRLANGHPITMARVSCPLLMVPFAAWAALHLHRPIQVRWHTLRIETGGNCVWIDDPDGEIDRAEPATLTCQIAGHRRDAATSPGLRGIVAPDIWAALDTFAQRTFAPATAASRLLGAGTGLSDND